MDACKTESSSLESVLIKQEIHCIEDLKSEENESFTNDYNTATSQAYTAWPSSDSTKQYEEHMPSVLQTTEQWVDKFKDYEDDEEQKRDVKLLSIDDIKVEVNHDHDDDSLTHFVSPGGSVQPLENNQPKLECTEEETKLQMGQLNYSDSLKDSKYNMTNQIKRWTDQISNQMTNHQERMMWDKREETKPKPVPKAKLNNLSNQYKCEHCKYTTSKSCRLFDHTKAKHDVRARLYKCKLCGYATKIGSYLNRHITKRHDPNFKIYICKFCDYTSRAISDFKAHVKVRHNPDTILYRCPTCKFSTKDRQCLNTHAKVNHRQDIGYECNVCDYIAESMVCLSEHLRLEHDIGLTLYKCAECEYVVEYRHNLKYHKNTHKLGEVYKSSKCDFHRQSFLQHFTIKDDTASDEVPTFSKECYYRTRHLVDRIHHDHNYACTIKP